LSGADDVARAIAQPVALADYDAGWPAAFEAERRRLMEALPGRFVAIEHIGSTAVPGLRAKPLLDLLAGVPTIEDAYAINDVMDRIGYTTSPAMNASLKTRQWFMRQSGGHRTHHLHVVVHDDVEWTKRIGFRDRLRADPALRARYVALKEDLARRFGDDRDAYTEGKSDFILAAAEGPETA
jgi:GrpB-like predicted nucleotidyltransferase (UPF0157 family)